MKRAITESLTIYALVLATAILCYSAKPARSHESLNCGDRKQIEKLLTDNYNERPTLNGVAENGGYMQFFIADARTWTVTITLPSGLLCLMASGTDLETMFTAKVAH